MQSRFGLWVAVSLVLGLLLAGGCNREETPPKTGGMPMQSADAAAVQPEAPRDMMTMQDMRTDLLDAQNADGNDLPERPVAAGQAQGATATVGAGRGGALFQQHCSVCHPGGKNIINPQKPLDRQALAENGITRPEDIVTLLRNPGPGMTPFSPAMLSDAEARQVAEYILATY